MHTKSSTIAQRKATKKQNVAKLNAAKGTALLQLGPVVLLLKLATLLRPLPLVEINWQILWCCWSKSGQSICCFLLFWCGICLIMPLKMRFRIVPCFIWRLIVYWHVLNGFSRWSWDWVGRLTCFRSKHVQTQKFLSWHKTQESGPLKKNLVCPKSRHNKLIQMATMW